MNLLLDTHALMWWVWDDERLSGAADDAIGVAGLFEVARAFKAGPPPERSIVFGVWTAEERGLLGSEYWGEIGRAHV